MTEKGRRQGNKPTRMPLCLPSILKQSRPQRQEVGDELPELSTARCLNFSTSPVRFTQEPSAPYPSSKCRIHRDSFGAAPASCCRLRNAVLAPKFWWRSAAGPSTPRLCEIYPQQIKEVAPSQNYDEQDEILRGGVRGEWPRNIEPVWRRQDLQRRLLLATPDTYLKAINMGRLGVSKCSW